MNCQKCNSNRLLTINAKCSDMCYAQIGDSERFDYPLKDLGVGGGDTVVFTVCLNCGQMQGNYPLPKSIMEIQDADLD